MTKILIIRLSSIGDIVLTSPVVRCLKSQMYGGVEIHYLVKKKFYDVIKVNPYISKFHIIEKDISEIILQLKKENFDYIVDLHNNTRSFFVKQKLRKLSFTVNKINIRKWLMVNFKMNVLPKVHIVDRYFETVKSFGIENDGQGLDYFISPEDEVRDFPDSLKNNFVAFVIGGNYFTKKLPVKKIVSICKKINQPVILLGGKEDFANGEKIFSELQNSELIYNACGKYNINQSASIVKQAKKIITNDTGLMHIAAAFKKEIISVWGNTIPEFGMYPYYGNHQVKNKIVEVKNLNCRPCTKLGFSKCPKGHFKCMNEIDENEIVKEVNE